jgi:hypothetical protein
MLWLWHAEGPWVLGLNLCWIRPAMNLHRSDYQQTCSPLVRPVLSHPGCLLSPCAHVPFPPAGPAVGAPAVVGSAAC